MLWAACLLLDDDAFLVLEDDAQLAPDWAGAFAQALRDVPPDWDGLYLGSCCTGGYPRRHVRGRVYEVRYPLCTHAYAVRRKALGALIETQDAATCYGPIDITLRLHSWPRLRCYTILPRLANQHNTVIPT
jgi:GR25 family glycosyltransferase involved in LPS biosynthesis